MNIPDMDEISDLIEAGALVVRNGKLLIQWEDEK